MSTSRCGLASAKLTTSAAGSGQSWAQKRNNNLAHEARQGAEMALAANLLRQERRKGQTGGWPPFDHNARPNLRVDPFPDEEAGVAGINRGHAAGRRGSPQRGRLGQTGEVVPRDGSDDLRDDASGTAQSAHPQRAPASADCQRQRRLRDGAEHDAEQVCGHAANDEEDGEVPEDDGTDGRRGGRFDAPTLTPDQSWKAGESFPPPESIRSGVK